MEINGRTVEIVRLGVVDSTLQVLAQRLAQTPTLPDLSTVIASHQHAGRGRSGRVWLNDAGSALLCATLVRIPEVYLSWVTPLAGLATLSSLADIDVKAHLKWPNDVLLGGKKIAGILCEHLTTHQTSPRTRLHAVAVGLGLNLGTVPTEAGPLAGALPIPANTSATALKELLLASFLRHLDRLIDLAEPQVWRRLYRNALSHLGQESTVRLPDGGLLHVTATDVDHRGALLATTNDGTQITITAGDVDLPQYVPSLTTHHAQEGLGA
ncbi:biotin--[acetyl-CoA-carboxylase] ligase [Schaalia suimastitidis]|uniref:biotin--[acetyl-CoA-carboxylase] ligase n=1 Tax=Schaalia suimastitidis TaxID=121163 RepID=UPI0003F8287C|nr:biotin--[acetyl-CoA-carboxylase] ligase [Schaalia suimastitidis]